VGDLSVIMMEYYFLDAYSEESQQRPVVVEQYGIQGF
jgi:hypothetical protein